MNVREKSLRCRLGVAQCRNDKSFWRFRGNCGLDLKVEVMENQCLKFIGVK
jgi:hypothetical protein